MGAVPIHLIEASSSHRNMSTKSRNEKGKMCSRHALNVSGSKIAPEHILLRGKGENIIVFEKSSGHFFECTENTCTRIKLDCTRMKLDSLWLDKSIFDTLRYAK